MARGTTSQVSSGVAGPSSARGADARAGSGPVAEWRGTGRQRASARSKRWQQPSSNVGDVLTGEDTFTIIASSMEEVAKIKALHTSETMQACFGNEERIKRVIAKHEEEEKMKADEKPIDNEEFKRKMNELLKGSDDEGANTNNGGGHGEEDWDHFGEALQRHSSLKTKLRSWDLSVTNHCNSNRV
jgi:hypothetical protein